MLAWLMAKAANLSSRDVVLEPSAGNGALMVWASIQGASLLINEIDTARRDSLSHIFPRATISAHDGELIADLHRGPVPSVRSEEHTSELQSLMRISYAVFCLKNKKHTKTYTRSKTPTTQE